MKLSVCESCGQLLHFENSTCLRCGSPLGFIPASMDLRALVTRDDGTLAPKARPDERWRACANAAAAGCNWLLPADAAGAFCEACELNRTIPDLSVPGNPQKWQAIECAKRRLVYALLRLRLPLTSRHEDERRGLAFDFLADTRDKPVMTGHADGLITVNIAEADSAERERRRVELGEAYRTLLGHMRHEVGHYYWDLLVRDGGRIGASRAVFGDESEDYGEALRRYYATGAPPDWQAAFVSAYATMHPWEDFAETWTHYLHIVDTLDTAATFGLAVDPVVSDDPALNTRIAFDPYRAPDVGTLVAAWLPLTVAVNSLNRSMGQPDLYPFSLSLPAISKLAFIHDLVQGSPPSA
jgi:hypothetical protein